MIWRFFYSPVNGLLNEALRAVGLSDLARPWLGDFKLALYAILFVGFPWIAGYATLIYIAGLQAISMEILEAAAIDGASGFVAGPRVGDLFVRRGDWECRRSVRRHFGGFPPRRHGVTSQTLRD